MQAPPIWEVDAVLRSRSEVALAQGDAARAPWPYRRRASPGCRSWDCSAHLPEALLNLAQALEQLGRTGQGRASAAREAQDRTEQMNAPMLEWVVLYALGKFEAEHSRPVEAGLAWDRAREIVSAIAAKVPTPELRASFRARPELRALLGEPAPNATEIAPAAPARPAL